MRASWSLGPRRAKLCPRTASTAVAVREGPSTTTPSSGAEGPCPRARPRCRPRRRRCADRRTGKPEGFCGHRRSHLAELAHPAAEGVPWRPHPDSAPRRAGAHCPDRAPTDGGSPRLRSTPIAVRGETTGPPFVLVRARTPPLCRRPCRPRPEPRLRRTGGTERRALRRSDRPPPRRSAHPASLRLHRAARVGRTGTEPGRATCAPWSRPFASGWIDGAGRRRRLDGGARATAVPVPVTTLATVPVIAVRESIARPTRRDRSRPVAKCAWAPDHESAMPRRRAHRRQGG